MTDAEYIKQARKAYGITQQKFADKFHTTQQTIANWESGKTLPPVVKMAIQLKLEKDGIKL